MLEAFLGWLLGVVYNDSLGVVLGDLLGWFLLISGMILGDILGDFWWFYRLLSDDIRTVLE
jgi:hypothetical protein